MFGIVIPLLFGITVDLFVFMPIRSFNAETGLVIYISQVSTVKKKNVDNSLIKLLLELVFWCCLHEYHS